jgi:hypothetical protein
MPIPVKSRRYDQHFWEELQGKPAAKMDRAKTISELGF